MGKTGGDTTLRLFQLFPDLIDYWDGPRDSGKHARFSERPGRVKEKARALNIRRLPSWVLAFSVHKSQRGLAPDYRPGPMDSPYQMARTREPDGQLATFLEGGAISHWLRLEHLKEDFLTFISHYAEVSEEQRLAVERLTPVNTAAYDRDISHWFSDSHLELMYESNPLWARVERQVYLSATT